MKSKLFVFATAIALAFTSFMGFGSYSNANQPKVISYFSFSETEKWKLGTEMDGLIDGAKHYTFGEGDEIQLNIIHITDNLSKDISENNLKKFVEMQIKSKNTINNLFGLGPSKLVSYEYKANESPKVFNLITTQQIDATESVTVNEKILLFDNYAINTQLRWKNHADRKKVSEAQQSYEKLNVRLNPTTASN
jgi:hypothetical protein